MSRFLLVFVVLSVSLGWGANAGVLRLEPLLESDVETFELDENAPLRLLPHLLEMSYKKQQGQLTVDIKNTQDIIQLLQPHSSNPVVEGVLTVLALPEVSAIVDGVLVKYPELPRVIRSLREFFQGPEAKPLIDAFKESVAPILKTSLTLYGKIKEPVEDALADYAMEGIRLFFRLQTPEVVEVVRKVQKLPEFHELAGYLIVYNIDLVRALQRLETLLTGAQRL